jgi:ribonuclease-3
MGSKTSPLFSLLDKDVLESELFQQALTHRSASNNHNECLEFLGDSILNLIVTDFLYRGLPNATEGDLSRLRASLVNGKTLGAIGAENQLGEFLQLGSGELKSGGHRRHSIMEDAIEAIIGAVYLQRGFNYTQRFIHRLYGERLQHLPDPETLKDPKSRLQEWLQARGEDLPIYEVVDISGQAHQQMFTAECRVISRSVVTSGQGNSRRKAEQQAASRAFDALQVTKVESR